MSEIVTAESLRDDILQTGRLMRDAVDTYKQAAIDYVKAEDEYQRAWDRAFLHADGSELTRKSKANLQVADLAHAKLVALEAKRAAKLDMEGWQSIVNAYQSISATAREQMRLSR